MKALNNNGPQRRMSDMGRPVEKANDSWATIKRLFSYWKSSRWKLIFVMICSTAEVGLQLLAPLLIGKSIDECINLAYQEGGSVDFERLQWTLIALTIVYIGSALCSWLQEYLMAIASLNIVRTIREEMIEKLHTLSIRFFDTKLRGETMSHFTNDVELIRDALGRTVIQLISSVFTLVGTAFLMLSLSLELTGMVCLTIPLVILLSKFVMTRTRKFFSEQQQALGDLNGMIEENIVGMKVIRSFGQEEKQTEKFGQLNKKLQDTGSSAQIYSGILMPLMRVLDNLSYIIVTIAGSFLASRGSITVGVIQSFLLYSRNFQRPVNQIATQFNSVQSAIAGAERIFKLLDEKPEITDKVGAKTLEGTLGRVCFDHVTFGYEKGKPIVKDISFTAEPGEVIAIVGGTGAGKSTLINLLTRFYDIDEGSITIDGEEISNLTQHSLRNALGIVLQEPFLFSESIKYNIGYGKPNASEEEIRQAAITANAYHFTIRLADGFETVLHEQGEDISHGQRQLLTIARAVLVNAPILILDEATSNIDTRTEILIQKAIANLTQGKTCFIIAHRLSTIKNADKILVMENGRIVESGKHEELIQKGGVYEKIYSSQFE
ncbi:MAG: ABC transporter ATP-binding protein [Paludibacteraceae bacterium]|nr:ABC transporter ATP-binding protein [Paludibacteraceae bacterium]